MRLITREYGIFFVSFLEYNSVAKVNKVARLKKWEYITVVIPKTFNALIML